MGYVALEKYRAIEQAIAESEVEYKKLYKQARDIDLEIMDILHIIELGTYNAAQGYKLTSKLKELRKKRRILKDELSIYQSIRINFNNKNCNRASQESKKAEQTLENRTYSFRVMKKDNELAKFIK